MRNLSIGYIFQDYHLIDDMSVFDNIALVLKMIGIKDPIEIKSRVNYVLETVGIYRYRNRLAGMLSGGERQRVGIARAIVKNPDIILADEPTGNLDSKNTIEIMNIIKSISKDKLVLLVTHEQNLAYFYASRIIELIDGKIVNDYQNEHQNDLDYQIENKIYLKDLTNNDVTDKKNYEINYYGNNQEKIVLDIVVVNNNIYVKSNSKEKIEVIDNNSNIELINDTYQKITKKDYEKYDFDLSKLDNSKYRLKYTSIYNPISLFINGMKKVFNYSFLKKLLLIGFFVSGMFILYGLSNILGVTNIHDKDFIADNREYLIIKSDELNVNNYLFYETLPGVNYLIPGDAKISLSIEYKDYYQVVGSMDNLTGSLTSINNIDENYLIFGEMPTSRYEFVADKLTIEKMLDSYVANQIGIFNPEEFIGRTFKSNSKKEYVLVGITDNEEPTIYVDPANIINLVAHDSSSNSVYPIPRIEEKMSIDPIFPGEEQSNIFDYELFSDQIKIKKGKYPLNDYEVIVDYQNRYSMPLNKTIDQKINNIKLKVVGYYEMKNSTNQYFVNNNTIKYDQITKKSNIIVMPNDKELALTSIRENDLNVEETYAVARREYVNSKSKNITASITVSAVILIISFVEIFLIIRSSFLSRIKEVGILRAIGMKKKDIYKMFLGEILAITCTASVLGLAFMTFVIDRIMTTNIFASQFMLNYQVVLASFVLILIFNVIIGLIPVFNTIKKTPAAILSRTDVD